MSFKDLRTGVKIRYDPRWTHNTKHSPQVFFLRNCTAHKAAISENQEMLVLYWAEIKGPTEKLDFVVGFSPRRVFDRWAEEFIEIWAIPCNLHRWAHPLCPMENNHCLIWLCTQIRGYLGKCGDYIPRLLWLEVSWAELNKLSSIPLCLKTESGWRRLGMVHPHAP